MEDSMPQSITPEEPQETPEELEPHATQPPDPERINHGTPPGQSYGERWTNKVYSTPDPDAEKQPDAEGGKHHEPTPFLRG
jgi:hypothetical protein